MYQVNEALIAEDLWNESSIRQRLTLDYSLTVEDASSPSTFMRALIAKLREGIPDERRGRDTKAALVFEAAARAIASSQRRWAGLGRR